jgi:preprotein translocase subunit YajC
MSSQYRTFLNSESLKLSKLKKGDFVVDTSGNIARVTKKTSKRFAVDGGLSNKSHLNWTRVSRVGIKLNDFVEKSNKLKKKEKEYRRMLNDSKLNRNGLNESVFEMFRQNQEKMTESFAKFDNFLWNVANGKMEEKGGADDDDLDYFLKNEDYFNFNQYKGSNREKVKEWLIDNDVKEPPPEISCIIS